MFVSPCGDSWTTQGGWTSLAPCEGSAMVIIGRDIYIPLARSHNKKLHNFSVLVDRHFPSSPFHWGICIPLCSWLCNGLSSNSQPQVAKASFSVPTWTWKPCLPLSLKWNMYQGWEHVETDSSVLLPSYLRVGSEGSYVIVVFSLFLSGMSWIAGTHLLLQGSLTPLIGRLLWLVVPFSFWGLEDGLFFPFTQLSM